VVLASPRFSGRKVSPDRFAQVKAMAPAARRVKSFFAGAMGEKPCQIVDGWTAIPAGHETGGAER
jgi:hypothetical protein